MKNIEITQLLGIGLSLICSSFDLWLVSSSYVLVVFNPAYTQITLPAYTRVARRLDLYCMLLPLWLLPKKQKHLNTIQVNSTQWKPDPFPSQKLNCLVEVDTNRICTLPIDHATFDTYLIYLIAITGITLRPSGYQMVFIFCV